MISEYEECKSNKEDVDKNYSGIYFNCRSLYNGKRSRSLCPIQTLN